MNIDQSAYDPSQSDAQFRRQLKSLDQRGSISLILGTMFAGKSTELLRQLTMHQIAGKSILKVKFSADQRYGNLCHIATHTGQKKEAIPLTTLAEMGDLWRDFDVIGVDEGQFFCDIISFAETAANAHKIVIISSLQGTFQRGKWQNITELIPLCEKVKKLSAICKLCKVNASFTFRTADKNCQNMIGGADMYMPLCRDCHARESLFNATNKFEGDPELVNLKAESEAQLLKEGDPKSFSTEENSSEL